jgi:hypothetical protein
VSTPIQNDNNPGEGPLAQNDIEPNDERYNEFHAEGVPGQGWDGTGFDVAPETQVQELLNHMREVSQWSDTFAFMYPRQVDRFLQPVFALCRDVLRLQTCSLSNPDAESTNSNTNITGILKSVSRELNEVKNEIARINKTATKGNRTTGLDQVETDHQQASSAKSLTSIPNMPTKDASYASTVTNGAIKTKPQEQQLKQKAMKRLE